MAVVMRHAALPPEASGTMLAVFEPGTPEDQVFAALTRADARIVKPGGLSFIWVVGALGAYRELPVSPVIAGCFAFADAKVASFAP